MLAFILLNWRIIAYAGLLLGAAATVGVMQHRLTACGAELSKEIGRAHV